MGAMSKRWCASRRYLIYAALTEAHVAYPEHGSAADPACGLGSVALHNLPGSKLSAWGAQPFPLAGT